MNNKRRIYRSRDDRVIAGVCGGLGHYFNIDAIIFRIIFLVSIAFGGLGILVYLICWLVISVSPTSLYEQDSLSETHNRRLFRSAHHKMIAGVCGGLAEYLDMDPTVVRLLFVLSLLVFGVTFIMYLVMWIIVPLNPNR